MRLAIAACLALTMTPAMAQKPAATSEDVIAVYGTGETLTKQCRAYMTLVRNQMKGGTQLAYDAGQCYAYVIGVLDTLAFEGIQPSQFLPKLCLPRGVNANSATEVVANFADQNPQAREASAYAMVRKALSATYPCRS